MYRHLSSLCRFFPSKGHYNRKLMTSGLNLIKRQVYTCGVDAEPLERYRPGGYHPIHIGDTLKEGRYKILQKLGFGGYSTVWAARDQTSHRNVAIKVSISEIGQNSRELRILRLLSANSSLSETRQHMVTLLDEFVHSGPNGLHACLILELLGPSVSTYVEERCPNGRMPGMLAKEVSRQALLGLECLHHLGISHGDLHVGNIAFTLPGVESLSEKMLVERLGTPDIGSVTETEGRLLGPEVPKYLVWPTSFSISRQVLNHSIKIIDFGQSFTADDKPSTFHTPPALHPPELLLKQDWDYRVDLWSVGCMIFELVTGQPPFDNFFYGDGKKALLRQIINSVGNVPKKWEKLATLPAAEESVEDIESCIEDWLEEVYFDEEKKCDLSHDDIKRLKLLLRKLICFDPDERQMAGIAVKDAWFASS